MEMTIGLIGAVRLMSIVEIDRIADSVECQRRMNNKNLLCPMCVGDAVLLKINL